MRPDDQHHDEQPTEVTSLWGKPTRWTVIQGAAGADHGEREKAWCWLTTRYRVPVMATIERLLYRSVANRNERGEIADDFFSYLFEKEVLARVDPEKGRFRCFMQGVIRRYVLQRLRPDRLASAASTDEVEVTFEETPELERLEESAWAHGVLLNAAQRLLQGRGGSGGHSEDRDGVLLLKAYGIAPYTPVPRAELAREAGLSIAALNVAIHRARQRLRALILDEIRLTVGDPESFVEEASLLCARLLEAQPTLISAD